MPEGPLVAWARANLGSVPGSPDPRGPLGARFEELSGNGRMTEGRGVRPTFGRLTLEEAALLLQGLLFVDVHQLLTGEEPISKALVEGRLKYIRRDPDEHFRSIREIWQHGGGDCEDLATAVAAEACVVEDQLPDLFSGAARPYLYRVRPGLSHIVSQLRSGQLLDPSRTGGMGRT